MPRRSKASSASLLGKRIGRNVKLARTALGITQSQLAEKLDIESVTVSRIETGAQLPSIDRLEQIADVLKVSLQSLVGDTSKAAAFGGMVAEVTKDLPASERDFVYSFVVNYAQHWKAGRKK